jgi:hypothetical protein
MVGLVPWHSLNSFDLPHHTVPCVHYLAKNHISCKPNLKIFSYLVDSSFTLASLCVLPTERRPFFGAIFILSIESRFHFCLSHLLLCEVVHGHWLCAYGELGSHLRHIFHFSKVE